ncbi:BrnA antitoxin family protein [Bdellovibrio bacteriovorus]|uniref:BrnA antitoxin family protein n=1 Tax=Bdellovibrio bacteriovorus TaxID=959 RepID=UPI0021D1F1D6|nr:BrnA antitoxin family protein [Bdellovibrio bacteriovorus]UXR65345.1 BrnA antitoxin family protein [Bdellovibrio bacteriovorus]
MKKPSSKKSKSQQDPLDRDLSSLIENGKWKSFADIYDLEIKKKDTTITLRVPADLLAELKKIANKDKTDYQKLIRKALIELVIKRAS